MDKILEAYMKVFVRIWNANPRYARSHECRWKNGKLYSRTRQDPYTGYSRWEWDGNSTAQLMLGVYLKDPARAPLDAAIDTDPYSQAFLEVYHEGSQP